MLQASLGVEGVLDDGWSAGGEARSFRTQKVGDCQQ